MYAIFISYLYLLFLFVEVERSINFSLLSSSPSFRSSTVASYICAHAECVYDSVDTPKREREEKVDMQLK